MINPFCNIESTAFMFKYHEENKISKGNLVWADDKSAVKWQPDTNCKYIVGIDPYRKDKWRQKILSFLGLRKKDKSVISIFRINDDGSLELQKVFNS